MSGGAGGGAGAGAVGGGAGGSVGGMGGMTSTPVATESQNIGKGTGTDNLSGAQAVQGMGQVCQASQASNVNQSQKVGQIDGQGQKPGSVNQGQQGQQTNQKNNVIQDIKVSINNSYNSSSPNFKNKYGNAFKKLMQRNLDEKALLEILKMLQQKRMDELVKMMMSLMMMKGDEGSQSAGQFVDVSG